MELYGTYYGDNLHEKVVDDESDTKVTDDLVEGKVLKLYHEPEKKESPSIWTVTYEEKNHLSKMKECYVVAANLTDMLDKCKCEGIDFKQIISISRLNDFGDRVLI